MLLVDEQRDLIGKIVRENKNFPGNEDLFEDFCSEAFQKSYMIFNSPAGIEKIESYVTKVVHTSVLSVLKNSGRVRRSASGFVPTKEVKIDDLNVKVSPEVKGSSFVSGREFISEFPDPKENVEDVLITKDCLRRIVDAVCVIHKELPGQLFFDIFYLRYVKGMKQSEAAKVLNISQSEISKRLLKLSKLISNFLDGD